jgi:magnesium chelatase subunit D
MARRHTPFPAIVGQPELKRALLAVAADDALDGVLVRGERGTAKSTAVRALADLLPDQRAVADCPYGCPPDDPDRQCESCQERTDPPVETRSVPLVTLPLGATRERVVGTLSVADALEGDAEFDPGLLARANRGILYVDEVNLLDDHLVDVLLDAAAGGVNRVERDGVSVEHPAEFTLIGTMNPEEGELRPQLRDRFALQTTVTGSDDIDDRVAIIEQALGADGNSDAGSGDGGAGESESLPGRYREETDALRERLRRARELIGEVDLSPAFKAGIAELCRDAGVDGHRADIATARTARTLAALDGRSKVIESDVEEAASFALPHRLRRQPFDDAPDVDDVLDEQFGEEEGDERGDGGTEDDAGGDGNGDDEGETPSGEASDDSDEDRPADEPDPEDEDRSENGEGAAPESADGPAPDADSGGPDAADSPAGASAEAAPEDGESDGDGGSDDADPDETATPLVPGERRAEVGDAAAPPVEDVAAEAAKTGGGSRMGVAPSTDGQGPRVRTERATDGDVDAAASVRAAAADGRSRVAEEDLRTSVRADTAGALVVFVVDASASMRPAMREAKGTVLSLLEDAYQQRDEVAFVAVAGDDAEVLLPPTDSVALAARHLKELPAGDRTPLPAGLDAAGRLLGRGSADAGIVVVVTDGRANVAGEAESPTRATRAAARRLAAADPSVVLVDAGDDGAGVTDIVEAETDATRVPLSELSAERVVDAATPADDGK